MLVSEQKNIGEAGRKNTPGIFFVADENLNDSWGGGGGGRVRKKGQDGVRKKRVPLCVKLRGLDRGRSPRTKVRDDLSTNAQGASVIGTGRRTC